MSDENDKLWIDFDRQFFLRIAKVLGKASIVLVVICCILGYVHYITDNSPEVLQAHSDLLAIYDQLELGMSLEFVLALSLPASLSRTDHTNGNSGEVEIATPLIWHHNNWILLIAFDEARVVGKYIGTPDSAGEHPKNAPRDIFVPGKVPSHRERYAPKNP